MPFKRNGEMLEILPKGVMHFPATGINDNLADKARKAPHPGVEVRRRVSAAHPSWR